MHKTDELPEPEKSPAEAGQKLVFGNAEKEKAAKRRTKKTFYCFGENEGKFSKCSENKTKNERKQLFFACFSGDPNGT